MSTAIDTNILVDLLAGITEAAQQARDALVSAQNRGGLVISAPVYAELLAFPGRSIEDVDGILAISGITIDWSFSPATWRRAGTAFAAYATRRRRSGGERPRRILADFLIGAHANEIGELLTRDVDFYRINFPEQRLVNPS